MKVLLDTHMLLWWLSDDRRLPAPIADVLADGSVEVAVSAATVWEIGIKRALGKLRAPADLLGQIREQQFTPWPITLEDGAAAADLPRHHDDPVDRVLIAQAGLRSATLASVDRRFGAYGVPLIGT